MPSAGLRWMIVGHPQKISENADLSAALTQLLPKERLDAFAASSGIDLRRLPNALIAGFDLGTLYLAETSHNSAELAREHFVERLGGRELVERPHPDIVRVSGTLDGKPHSFFDLDGKVVGLAAGDLTLSRIAVGYALGKLKKTPTALRGAALSSLPRPAREPLLTFYAPGPFEDEWARALHGVLAAALAIAIQLDDVQDGYLQLTLFVAGDWADGGQRALEQLQAAFLELSASSTGKLFAFERARAITGSFHPQYLTLSVQLPLDPLMRGLRAAVVADVWEILDLPVPSAGDAGALP
ncbi:MAG TPA: hypothetical protein VGP93_19345 [Polyangiaceae bacterium]|nr:hypothetical protein [Polyangiaceae bacterium]